MFDPSLQDLDRRLAVEGALERAAVLRDALQQAGLPLDRRIDALGEGQPHPWGLSTTELAFEGLELLGLPPATWLHRVHGTWTRSFSTTLWLADTAERALTRARSLLEPRLGVPSSLDLPGNRLRWDLGLTWVELRILGPGVTTSHNPMLQRHPELLDAVTVEIVSLVRVARVEPLVESWLASSEPLGTSVEPVRVVFDHLELHPSAWASGAPGTDRVRLWRTDDRFGVSATHASLVVLIEAPPWVDHFVMEPARGRGYSTLCLTASGLSVAVSSDEDHRALDGPAKALASRLGLELRTRIDRNV